MNINNQSRIVDLSLLSGQTDQQRKLVIYSQRPPLAKRIPTQSSNRTGLSNGLNLRQFDAFFNAQKKEQSGNLSNIIEQKENISYSGLDRANIQDSSNNNLKSSNKTRVQSGKPFSIKNSVGVNSTRSQSQNRNQNEVMRNLIAISSIMNIEKPFRDIHSAKSSNNSMVRQQMNQYQRFESFEEQRSNQNHSRQRREQGSFIQKQKSIRNLIPTKHISMNEVNQSSSNIESKRSNSRSNKQNNVQSPQATQIKRQNSDIAQSQKDSQQQLPTSQLSTADRLRRIKQVQTSVTLPHITAQSWAIFDRNTQKMVQGKKENYKREIASITKMMTFYTSLKLIEKYGLDPEKIVITVSRTASRTNGTTACLREGDQLTLNQLFYGLMLPSGNDAAYSIAEYFGQYLLENKYHDQVVTSFQFQWSIVRYFLKEMNLNAFKLRMFSSQFDSPHGLSNKHNYSTASDVCLLGAKCMELDHFRRVVNTVEFKTQALNHHNHQKQPTQYTWENTNKLLGYDDGGFIGCKTGITDPAGPCFCGGYEKDGNRYIVVVLCSKTMEQRWIEVPKMVEWAIKKKRVMEEFKQQQKSGEIGSKIKMKDAQSSNGFEAIREEIIDKNTAVFKLGFNTPTFTMKQETYVPRSEALLIITKIESEAKKRIEQYKEVVSQLMEKQALFEKESDDYYMQIIQDQKVKIRAAMKQKEDLLVQLQMEKEEQVKQMEKLNLALGSAEDQLQIMKAQEIEATAQITGQNIQIQDLSGKLAQIEQEYVELQQREPPEPIEREKIVQVEDDSPVDPEEYEKTKKKRAETKQMIGMWYVQFERENKREPEIIDFHTKIKGMLDEYLALNQEYTAMKLKLLKSGALDQEIYSKLKKKEQVVTQAPLLDKPLIDRPHTQATHQQVEPQPQPTQLKKQNNFMQEDEPSPTHSTTNQNILTEQIAQLKLEIHLQDERKRELQDQIDRLQKILSDNVGEDEVFEGLQLELQEQKRLIEERDSKINNLIEKEKLELSHKQEIIKDLQNIIQERDFLQSENSNLREQLESHVAHPVEYKSQKSRSKQQTLQSQSSHHSIISQKEQQNQSFHQNDALLQDLDRVRKENSDLKKQIELLKQVQAQQQPIQSDSNQNQPIQFYQKQDSIPKDSANNSIVSQKQVQQVLPQQIAVEPQIITKIVEVVDDKKIKELEQINQQKDHEIANLTKKIHQLEKTNEEYKNLEKEKQVQEAGKIEGQVQEFRQKLMEKKEKVRQLKDKQSELEQQMINIQNLKQNEIAELKEEYEKQIQTLELEVQALKREQQKLQQSGQSSIQILQEQHQRDIANLIQSHQAEIMKREEAINAHRVQIDKIEKARTKLQDQLTDLEITLDHKAKEEQKLKVKLGDLEKIAGDAARYEEEAKELGKQLNEAQGNIKNMEDKYKEEQKKRKALHNELEDSKGKIRVYCRVRPLTRTELEREESKYMAIKVIDEFQLVISGKAGPKPFTFDSIFGPDSTQDQVFEESKRLVQSAIDGFNVCIFAYGQTGSGKTFTIQGTQNMPGITPRAIDELFNTIGDMNNYQVKLSCYMVELYKDELRDLLIPKNANRTPLEIKDSATGMVVINGVTEQELNSIQEANRIFNYGLEHRMTRATKMNDASSRSHLIFAIVVDAYNRQTRVRTVGKLSFVDLAGSENSKKTGTDKEGADEARAINQSLSALGNVIKALSEGNAHIPYRDHPLTKLMKDSLGGSAKTLMFVNVSPSIYNESESKNSMDYATRVKKIKNKVTKNVETKETSYLKTTVIKLESLLGRYKDIIMRSNLADELNSLQELANQLEPNDGLLGVDDGEQSVIPSNSGSALGNKSSAHKKQKLKLAGEADEL